MAYVAPYLPITHEQFRKDTLEYWYHPLDYVILLVVVLSLRTLFKMGMKRLIAKHEGWEGIVWTGPDPDAELAAKEGRKPHRKSCEKTAALLWLALYKTVLSIVGITAITSQSDGISGLWYVPPNFWHRSPHVPESGTLLSFYIHINIGFFLSETIASFASIRHRRDEAVLLGHHFITLTLIVLGMKTGYVRGMACVLNIHEVAMPFINTAKAMFELNKEHKGKVFVVGSVFVILTRMVWFPWMLWVAYFRYPKEENQELRVQYLYIAGFLQVVHCYFTVLISKIAFEYIHTGIFKDVGSFDYIQEKRKAREMERLKKDK